MRAAQTAQLFDSGSVELAEQSVYRSVARGDGGFALCRMHLLLHQKLGTPRRVS